MESGPRLNRRAWSAALACVALGACSLFIGAPSAGTLEPVYAKPAELVEVHRLAFGETLGGLLVRSLDGNEEAALLMAFGQHASSRRIRENTEVTLRYLAADESLRGVDVALNRDETVRLARGPLGWEGELIPTPVYVDTLLVSGEIASDLWTSVVNNPALATMPTADRNDVIDRLDRVFQWQIDFSIQVRVGDTYRFALEREARPDGSLRSGTLLAAEFVNQGTSYYAVWFDPNGDGQGSYFDLDGKSVRRAFLLKPLTFRRISGRFTNSRLHPILGTWRAHRGIDYAADEGTEVEATSDGVVVARGPNGGYGNMIEIRHPNGFHTRYGHMRGFARGISVGTRVHQGQVIGYVGHTGLATGPHLHYEMLRGGRQVDPLAVDLPKGDPVPAQDQSRWRGEMTARVALLDLVPPAGPVRTNSAESRADETDGDGGGVE